MYWDINKSLSYNALFNFIIGARGVGKSYGAKKLAIQNFLKKGKQFVYVRRYKEELKKINKFFDDIKGEFPEHEFKVSPPNFIIDNKIAGTAIPLSTAKIEKSTPYPNVTFIIFDEFILDKGYHHYLPDEVTNFLELYSTVSRSRDVIVYFLSNALSITNPYFIYFNLSLPYGKNIQCKNDILIEMVVDNEYSNKMSNTRFGKLIKNTPYGNYAISNTFLRDNKTFIKKKTSKATCQFIMTYKNEDFGVWVDYNEGLMYVSKDFDPYCKLHYSFTLDDHTINTMLLKGKTSTVVNNFIEYYKLGLVRFESIGVKNIVNDIIKMTL